jgi:hypothetical protein
MRNFHQGQHNLLKRKSEICNEMRGEEGYAQRNEICDAQMIVIHWRAKVDQPSSTNEEKQAKYRQDKEECTVLSVRHATRVITKVFER